MAADGENLREQYQALLRATTTQYTPEEHMAFLSLLANYSRAAGDVRNPAGDYDELMRQYKLWADDEAHRDPLVIALAVFEVERENDALERRRQPADECLEVGFGLYYEEAELLCKDGSNGFCVGDRLHLRQAALIARDALASLRDSLGPLETLQEELRSDVYRIRDQGGDYTLSREQYLFVTKQVNDAKASCQTVTDFITRFRGFVILNECDSVRIYNAGKKSVYGRQDGVA